MKNFTICTKFILCFLLLSGFAYAQSGKDGNVTISASNTVLNRYTRAAANIAAGATTITVTSINDLNRTAPTYLPSGFVVNNAGFSSNALSKGDLIIIYQAQGATVNNTNSINYGAVLNYNGAGTYELVYVESVADNVITLSCATKLSYAVSRYVQIIRVPQFNTLTVNTGASVVAIPWGAPTFGGADPSAIERRRGGFNAFFANNLINNGSINANNGGFRGGTIDNDTSTAGAGFINSFFSTSTFDGAEKGESIAGYRPDYDALGGRYGRGAAANGGGGGNGHNAGGGGGANGGNPLSWFRGAGVMNDFSGTCGALGAWTLDPNYIANGNALTNSSGGGQGGYTYSANNLDACTVGPSYPANFIAPGNPATDKINATWGGDFRDAVGGLGGRPVVPLDFKNQIFFGGGGGAGDGNNDANSDGADGGGIVFVIVSNTITGTGTIQANGENAPDSRNTHNDSPGGGGGGGTVLVQSTSINSTQTINANGGNGGTQLITGSEGEGPGGGGGGGVISINATTDNSIKTIFGGRNGRTTSSSLTEFPANGATSGNVGSILAIPVNLNSSICLATDVGVTKTVDVASVIPGATVVFTISVTNNGPKDATGVSVLDNLPSGYTATSAVASAGTWTAPNWVVGNLTNGASQTLKITATVNATGPYVNTAVVTSDFDTDLTNNSSSIGVTIKQSNLSIVKTVSNTTPKVGDNVTFTLTAANAGPNDATGIVVTDNLPTGYTFVSATPSVGTYSNATGLWTLGNLANGANATLAVIAKVNPTGVYANTATVSGNEPDPDPLDNTDTEIPGPIKQSNLSIVKTVSNTTPKVGDNVTFTLTAANAGPNDATGIVVTDNLPTGYTFVSATPSVGTYSNATGLWTLGNLANGANATLAVIAKVNPTGVYANTATVSGNEPDPDPLDNTDTEIPGPIKQSNLSIVKTVSNTTPKVGDNVTFTLTAANAGPNDATGIVVTDNLPTGYTFVSATPSVGTYSNATGLWTLGNLANGANATLAVIAKVNPTGVYANTATVSGNEPDPDPLDNTDTEIPGPIKQSNLSIVKTVSNTTPKVGDNVTFTLTAANAGPNDATGIVVTDNLPTGYTFVSATPSVGTYSNATGLWTLGNLANGANATLAVIAKVNPTGVYANTATVSGNEPDPDPLDNTDTEIPGPIKQSNLSIVKTVSNSTPKVGDNVTFTLTAANAGPNDATGIVVTDNLPTGYTFVSATPSVGTYSNATGLWTLGNLANAGTATLAVVVKVNPIGVYANTATVSGNEPDPDPLDNTDTEIPGPIKQSNLSIVKTVSNSTPKVGDNVTFTLTAANAGPNDATGIVVTDNLPTGYTFVSATPSVGTYSNATGLWTLGNLANGANATLAVIAKVNPTGVYANTATVSGNEPDPDPLDNTDTEIPGPIKQSNLSIVKTVSNSTPKVGDNVTFTLTAANAGPNDATGIVVTDNLPTGYTFVSATPSVGTYSNATGLWTLGNLANAGTATLAVVVKVNPTGVYANTATISGNQPDPDPLDNTDTEIPSVIDAVNDDYSGTPISVGESTPTVIKNDTLNGAGPVVIGTNPGQVVLTGVTVPSGLTLNSDGTITVNANTPSGNYSVLYSICEVGSLNPAGNCDQATALVVVTTIDATADTSDPINGTTGGNTPSIFANDTLNGLPFVPTDVVVTTASPLPTGLTLNVDGTITVAPNTIPGTYPVTYTICQVANSGICDTAIATVIVTTIDATADTPDPISGIAGGNTPSIFTNDTLDGLPFVPTDVVVTTASPLPTGLILNVDGTITVAPNTIPGTYPITYTICQVANSGICDTAIVTVLVQTPAIEITKDGVYADTNNDGKVNVGDAINYTFVVKNTGNVTVSGITVMDNNATVTGGPITLIAGATDATTFKGSHAITQADLDSGVVYNLATAKGKDPKGNDVTDTSSDPTPCTTCPVKTDCLDCTITQLSQTPAIEITKDGFYADTNNDGKVNVGDAINYTFVVKNTGNVTVSGITVMDNNATVTGEPITLIAGATDATTFKGSHAITPADLDSGIVYNLATAKGKDPKGNDVTDTSSDPTPCTTCPVKTDCLDCTITELSQTLAIEITKDGVYADTNNDGKVNVGDAINYTFVVKNTGNVKVSGITVMDNNATVTGGPITLIAGATDATTFKGSHAITQADLDSGIVYNLATAKGKDPKGNDVTDTSSDPTPCTTCPVKTDCLDCTITLLTQKPSIAIVKQAVFDDNNNDGIAQVGETITYNFIITNTGNVKLSNITISDPLPGVVVTGSPIELGVGQIDSTSFTAIYKITQADIIAESVSNQAIVSGTSPSNIIVTDKSDANDNLGDNSTVLGLSGCQVEVYNALSPDGDGNNDFLYISGIECYPNNEIMIFNRWGVQVFEAKGYDNKTKVFKGFSEGRTTVNKSESLPTGAYFYILQYSNTDGAAKEKQGYLYINR